jgi:peptidoglycan/xylan/chitin deacetylase (PgdA/CDA1 family)
MSNDQLRTALLNAQASEAMLHRAQLLLHRSGLGEAFVRLRGTGGAIILMYHAIVREEDEAWIDPRFSVPLHSFAQQMDFLAHHRRVVPLEDIIEAIEEGRTLSPGTVAITFDDGYRSTLELAAPILEHYRLPATVYLATGYVTREESQWIDVLYSSFAHRSRHRLDLSPDGIGPVQLRGAAVTRTYGLVADKLLGATIEKRQRLLSEVLAQLRPVGRAPRLTLSWDEADKLRLRSNRVDIGVHTRDHVDLASPTRQIVAREIEACVGDLERELGFRPRHFSFPYGRCTPEARQVVAQTFRSAAVTEPPALVGSKTDRLGLPRVAAPRSTKLFPFWTSGAYPDLPRTLLRRPRPPASKGGRS